jgi:hypothetical protein
MLQNSTVAFHVDRRPLVALPPLGPCPDAQILNTTVHSLNVPVIALIQPGFVPPHTCSSLKADSIDLVRLAQKVELK